MNGSILKRSIPDKKSFIVGAVAAALCIGVAGGVVSIISEPDSDVAAAWRNLQWGDGLISSLTCVEVVPAFGDKYVSFDGRTVPIPLEGSTMTKVTGDLFKDGSIVANVLKVDNGKEIENYHLSSSDAIRNEERGIIRLMALRCAAGLGLVPGTSG